MRRALLALIAGTLISASCSPAVVAPTVAPLPSPTIPAKTTPTPVQDLEGFIDDGVLACENDMNTLYVRVHLSGQSGKKYHLATTVTYPDGVTLTEVTSAPLNPSGKATMELTITPDFPGPYQVMISWVKGGVLDLNVPDLKKTFEVNPPCGYVRGPLNVPIPQDSRNRA